MFTMPLICVMVMILVGAFAIPVIATTSPQDNNATFLGYELDESLRGPLPSERGD
jgi:hypothetical protein